MPYYSAILSIPGLLFVLRELIRARSTLRGTTLGAAHAWGMVAVIAWIIAAACDAALEGLPQLCDGTWHVAFVLGLCPGIAVLGARRPTVRVWNAFVLVPLIAVLCWPLAAAPLRASAATLRLETPLFWGGLLVLVMGTGNFLGTRRGPAALAFGCGEWLAAAPLNWSTPDVTRAGQFRLGAVACVVLAAVLARRAGPQGATAPPSEFAWNRTWRAFRETFGVVWAQRLAERVNAQAIRGKWSVRLGFDGFQTLPGAEQSPTVSRAATAGAAHPHESGSPADLKDSGCAVGPDDPGTPAGRQDVRPSPDEAQEIDQTLRWLLRRFVDDDWIRARLEAGSEAS